VKSGERNANSPAGALGEIEAGVRALRGEGHYEDSKYAQLLQMRAIHRVGGVQRPARAISLRPSSPDLPLIHTALAVSRRRVESHLAPWDAYLKAAKVMRSCLRAYADSYIESAKDYGRWSRQNPKLARTFELDIGTLKPKPCATNAGGISMEFESRKKDRPLANARREAAILFLRFLTQPWAIGKCVHCTRYFLNRTHRKRRYCSRKCALYVTAIEATQRRRKKERQAKLKRVQDAVAVWQRHKPRGEWKSWVAARAAVTPKWITRAVNSGEIKPPKGP